MMPYTDPRDSFREEIMAKYPGVYVATAQETDDRIADIIEKRLRREQLMILWLSALTGSILASAMIVILVGLPLVYSPLFSAIFLGLFWYKEIIRFFLKCIRREN
jgi:hypothetical protein